LHIAASDIANNPDKFIHQDVVHASLHMQLQVLALIAKYLALFNYDPNLLR
jgi:hypothetical protein